MRDRAAEARTVAWRIVDWSDLEAAYLIAVVVVIALFAAGLAIVLFVAGVIRIAT